MAKPKPTDPMAVEHVVQTTGLPADAARAAVEAHAAYLRRQHADYMARRKASTAA